MKEIANLEIASVGHTKESYSYRGKQFDLVRIKNDVNGNPLYRIYLDSESLKKLKKSKGIGRIYLSKGYVVFQSYNIGTELGNIFNILLN